MGSPVRGWVHGIGFTVDGGFSTDDTSTSARSPGRTSPAVWSTDRPSTRDLSPAGSVAHARVALTNVVGAAGCSTSTPHSEITCTGSSDHIVSEWNWSRPKGAAESGRVFEM